jgi:hypothetical protein
MSKLAVFVGGCLFLAAAVVVLVLDKNWIGALFLGAIGVGLLLFGFRGE